MEPADSPALASLVEIETDILAKVCKVVLVPETFSRVHTVTLYVLVKLDLSKLDYSKWDQDTYKIMHETYSEILGQPLFSIANRD